MGSSVASTMFFERCIIYFFVEILGLLERRLQSSKRPVLCPTGKLSPQLLYLFDLIERFHVRMLLCVK